MYWFFLVFVDKKHQYLYIYGVYIRVISYHDTTCILDLITSSFSFANAWHWNLKTSIIHHFHFSTRTFNKVISWIVADRSMHRNERERMCARTHKRICRIIKSRVLCNHGKTSWHQRKICTRWWYTQYIYIASLYSLSTCSQLTYLLG